MSLVELARFSTRVEADLARLRLESEDIQALLFDAEVAGYMGVGHFLAVRLMVLDEDREAAERILTEGD